MKRVLVLVMLLSSLGSKAQTRISGKILDTKGKPLGGVSITLKNTYDGSTTDSLGNFSFTTTEKGKQVVEASIIGYRPFEEEVSLTSSALTLSISLKELVTELKAVVISAGAFVASDKNKGAVLNAIDIVTTPSANGDVTSAFKTLPGTQQVGESEGLFVRGGSATESKIYMDGNLVNNFFYSSTPGIATRGRFNPFLFKGTVFSSGGYSALYGQALSSALILESKDLPDRTEADLAISVIGLGGGIQHLAKNKKSSWGISYNYTNLWLAFKFNKYKQDFYEIPAYHQGDANFRIKTKTGGIIKYYGYISANKTGFRNPDIDSAVLKDAFAIENLNTYQNINWKDNLGNGWRIITGISYSTNKDDILNELEDANNQKQVITNPSFYAFKNFTLNNRAQYAQARVVLEKKMNGLNTLRFGSDYFYSNERSTYTLYDGSKFSETVKDNMESVFAEADIYLTNSLAAKVGSRLEHSDVISKWNIAPRLSVAYKFADNSQASFAYGLFYQNPERKYLPTTASLDYSRAAHYILQYQKLSSQHTFRIEAFYKKYSDLYKTSVNITGRETAVNNNGFGDAKGVEIFWRDKKTFKNVDYWISYSYLDTKRDFLNYPQAITPSFAANHTAALVVKKFVLPWKTGFNLSYNFATGRPYYRIAYDNTQSKYVISDAGKTINYNSMSFSINYLPNLGKTNPKVFTVWVLGINNVLGQNQVFNYNYSNDGNRKVAITPPSKRFIFIGCFLSFGIDRTQDAINNNL
ncbi:MAG: TonB-dependent receptor [Chitinophagaceae bacterium]|nr:TonB-dependent receptor [Chitinophagaceae bacterium]